FMVSLLKAYYGRTATKENDYNYSLNANVDGNSSCMYLFDDMYRGSSTRAGGKEPGPEGLISFGMNPVGTGPNSPKMVAALSKLKWLVMVENFENESATFWKAPKEYGGAAPKDIQTTVYQLPAANFAEKDGTFTNSSRWMQWKWKAIDPPGQAKSDQEILARIFLAVRDFYKKEGGALPEAVLAVDWSYTNPYAPDLGEVLKEINGKALDDLKDPKDPTKIIKKKGEQLDGFAQCQDDGSTMCGNWLHSGVYSMLPEGVGRLYSPVLNDGPFPEHYEAVEAPVDNALHAKVTSNPVSKKFSTDKDKYGGRDQFPIVCTTYRLTEHFHYWTKHHINGRLNEVQPEFFFEIPEELAKEKGIANGSKVKVTSARG